MFTLKIRTDNAAFNDDDAKEGGSPAAMGAELARILRDVACMIEDGMGPEPEDGTERDANGNTVCGWSFRP